MRSEKITAALAALLAACATTAPQPPTPAAQLAYGLPALNPATYELADTSNIQLETPGMGNVNTLIAFRTTAALGVHPDSAGTVASVRLTSLAGTFSNPAAGDMAVDDAVAPKDAALLVLAPTGAQSIRSAPVLTPEALRILGGNGVFHEFFVSLPGDTVSLGATWTDTLIVADSTLGVNSHSTSVVSSVWQRDSVLADGSNVHVIAASIATTTTIDGLVSGVEVRQRLNGTSTARLLWDSARNLLVSRDEQGTVAGTLDLPASNVTALPVRGTFARRLRLLP